MKAAQDNRCKICLVAFGKPQSTEGCVVDHDHDTGQVRALLCQTCNIILGYIELRSGLDHLEQLTVYVKETIGDKQRAMSLHPPSSASYQTTPQKLDPQIRLNL